MCKMWSTELTGKIEDDAMQVRGGRGYETYQSLKARGDEPTAIERFLRDCRINTIFEGSSEIMRLFIAREALDPHLKVGGAIFNTTLPMTTRVKSMFGSGSFYSRWYPRQFTKANAGDLSKLHDQLRPHVEYGATTSKKLARGLFHSMMRFGPKLDREQLLLSRFVGVATEIFAMNATCSYAQHLINNGKPAERNRVGRGLLLPLRSRTHRSAFRRHLENADARGYALVQELLGGKHEELRTGIV